MRKLISDAGIGVCILIILFLVLLMIAYIACVLLEGLALVAQVNWSREELDILVNVTALSVAAGGTLLFASAAIGEIVHGVEKGT